VQGLLALRFRGSLPNRHLSVTYSCRLGSEGD